MEVILIMLVASIGLTILSTRKATYMIASLFCPNKLIYVQDVSDNKKRFRKDIIINFIFLYLLLFLNFTKNAFYIAIIYVFICTHLGNVREIHEDISTSYIVFELLFRLLPFILIFII